MKVLPILILFSSLVQAPADLERPGVVPGITPIEYIGFSVGYDAGNKLPAWVAYELTAAECASDAASRKGKNFKQDTNISLPQADDSDYRHSGWTRGHMAPSADFKWSDEAQTQTFLFTNCCPQTEYLNSQSWEKLESRVRDWAKQFDRIYVVTGPVIGEHENGYLGENRIPIPDAFYKALLAQDSDGSYQSVAFVMHNISTPQPYPQCAMTVDELEEVIGINLFPMIPDSVESTVNKTFWGF